MMLFYLSHFDFARCDVILSGVEYDIVPNEVDEPNLMFSNFKIATKLRMTESVSLHDAYK